MNNERKETGEAAQKQSGVLRTLEGIQSIAASRKEPDAANIDPTVQDRKRGKRYQPRPWMRPLPSDSTASPRPESQPNPDAFSLSMIHDYLDMQARSDSRQILRPIADELEVIDIFRKLRWLISHGMLRE